MTNRPTHPLLKGVVVSLADVRAQRMACELNEQMAEATVDTSLWSMKERAFWANVQFFAGRLAIPETGYGRIAYRIVESGGRRFLDFECEAYRALYPLGDDHVIDLQDITLVRWSQTSTPELPVDPVPADLKILED